MSRYKLPDGNIIMANADFIAKTYPAATLLADIPVAPQPVEALAFLRRFTVPERISIRALAATDPVVYDFLDLLDKASSSSKMIDPADADTIAGVNYVESKGCIASDRVAQILS